VLCLAVPSPSLHAFQIHRDLVTRLRQLGYGDNDEATVVSYGPSSTSKYVTTYFRHDVILVSYGAVGSATLSMVVDDGAVVYVNGVEVARHNMPSGDVGYTTLAVSATLPEATWVSFALPPSAFVPGANTVAVEVHQAAVDSSDVSFKATLDFVFVTASTTASVSPSATASRSVGASYSPTPSPSPPPDQFLTCSSSTSYVSFPKVGFVAYWQQWQAWLLLWGLGMQPRAVPYQHPSSCCCGAWRCHRLASAARLAILTNRLGVDIVSQVSIQVCPPPCTTVSPC
jgi:hypothetical protein